MNDYRSKAVEVLNETSSRDTRGIIAAVLHLADAPDGRTTAVEGVAAGSSTGGRSLFSPTLRA